MKARHYTLIALAMLAAPSLAMAQKTAKKPAATAKKPVQTAKAAKAYNPTATMSPRAKALYEDMLPNTQRITFIDSTVVDKDRVLDAIPLPKAYGQFATYDSYFGTATGNKSCVFANGFGNRCYYTETDTDGRSRLYMRDRLGDGWGKPVAIREINEKFADISYPYMASDGVTLYFSGTSADDGLGHRDIYMTKYDAEEGRFMQAENIGLPFNSAADDYAYVIADADGLAWFATTRRQPEGKACVYTFITASSRQNYDIDELGDDKVMALADISSISATWQSASSRKKAIEHLSQLRSKAASSASGSGSVEFVVNDNTVYTDASQFRSDDTRKAFLALTRMQDELRSVDSKTAVMRTQYHNAKEDARQKLAPQIAQLERKASSLRENIRKSELELRRKENSLIKK